MALVHLLGSDTFLDDVHVVAADTAGSETWDAIMFSSSDITLHAVEGNVSINGGCQGHSTFVATQHRGNFDLVGSGLNNSYVQTVGRIKGSFTTGSTFIAQIQAPVSASTPAFSFSQGNNCTFNITIDEFGREGVVFTSMDYCRLDVNIHHVGGQTHNTMDAIVLTTSDHNALFGSVTAFTPDPHYQRYGLNIGAGSISNHIWLGPLMGATASMLDNGTTTVVHT